MEAAVAAVLTVSSAMAAQFGPGRTRPETADAIDLGGQVDARRPSRTLAALARALAGLADAADRPASDVAVDMHPLLLRALDQCALAQISEALSFHVCIAQQVRGPRRVHAGLARQMAASLLEAATLRSRAGLVRVEVDVVEHGDGEAVRIAVHAPMDDRSLVGSETVRMLRLLARSLGGELAVESDGAAAVWSCLIPAPRVD